MYSQPKGLASYSKIANVETDPIRQIVMLYDGAMKFLNRTADDIEAGDFVAKGEHSTRALDIINYLQSILDFENGGSVAESLDNLYRSIGTMVLRASARLDAASMRKAATILAPVRDAWETNAQQTVIPGAYEMSSSAATSISSRG
jgi:flagellar protein FliS